MSTYLLGYIYAFLFVIVGWFLAVYVDVLMASSKSFNIDSVFKYAGAAMFIIIIFGSMINWLRGCSINVQDGLPTFGLGERIQVIG